MNNENALLVSEAIFWIFLIASAPIFARIAYVLTLPLWVKLFRSDLLEITIHEGDKTLRVIVNRKTDYTDELNDAIKNAGMSTTFDEFKKH